MGVLVRHTVPDFLFLEGTIIGLLELFLIAVGLSMDAFAVSVCKGLSPQTLQRRHYLIVGAWFGGFQALMPTLGYLLGSTFEQYITSVDHWVAFIMLSVIGGNMLKEAFSKDEETTDASFAPRVMLLLAVATSIDALAVGVSMAFMKNVNIFSSALVIGVVAFGLAVVGGLAGRRLGGLFQKRAELVGGLVLIGIGLKILLEHLLG